MPKFAALALLVALSACGAAKDTVDTVHKGSETASNVAKVGASVAVIGGVLAAVAQ